MSRKIKVISGLALVTALTNVGNLVEADEQTQAAKEVSIANQPFVSSFSRKVSQSPRSIS